MRRLALLVLLLLAVAAPAAAGPKGKITVPAQPAVKLRGPQQVEASKPVAAAPVIASASPIPAPLAQAWSAPIPQGTGGDASQCRLSCAQTYYFCNAGGDDDCAPRWSQCAASCTVTAQAWQPSF